MAEFGGCEVLTGGAGGRSRVGFEVCGAVPAPDRQAAIAGRWPRAVGAVVVVVAGAQAGSAARRLNARAMAAAQGQSAGRCSVSWRGWRGAGGGRGGRPGGGPVGA